MWAHTSTSFRWTLSVIWGDRQPLLKNRHVSLKISDSGSLACTRGSSLVIRVSPQACVAKWVTNIQQLRIYFWFLGHPKEPRTHSSGLELLLLLELHILYSCLSTEGPLLCVTGSPFSGRVNSTLLPICNSLLTQASVNSSRKNTAPQQTSDNAQVIHVQ